MSFKTLSDIRQIEMDEMSDEYKTFTEKFKPKHTTDDCYTPDNIYDTVMAWVFKRYKLPEGTHVIRPFYPGGDYQREEYPDGCVVIDNPPFSIASKIVDWYQAHGVRFFLFVNGMTCGGVAWKRKGLTAVCVGLSIFYDNGAYVNTNFITNLSPDIMAESVPNLHDALEAANKANEKKTKKVVTKLILPDHIVTSARMSYLATHGTAWQVKDGDGIFTSKLDNYQGSIFGGGLLLTERAAAERAAAERAAALRVQLSDREKEIVRSMGSYTNPANHVPKRTQA